jgi:branched-chain amino acid aminotransferase
MTEVFSWKVIITADHYRIEPVNLPTLSATLDEASSILPGGSYTTFRTYGGIRVVRLSDHIARLHSAARLIERNHFTKNTTAIRSALREIISLYQSSEHRVRLTLDLEQEPGVVYISLVKMTPLPEHIYRDGVKAITCGIHRTVPKAKLTRFLTSANHIRSQLPQDVHEALMVSDGKILEGLSSNFFAVRDRQIWTAEEGVLSGVTRSVVIDEIRSTGTLIHLLALPVDDIPAIQEAFITSSSRGVLPVVQIDDWTIGAGVPGPITIQLHKSYLQRIEEELEEI